MKRNIFTIQALTFFLLVCLPQIGFGQIMDNALCPVMAGEKAREEFSLDYQGRRIYFCCKPCVKAFKKRTVRYLPVLEEMMRTAEAGK